MEYLFYIFSEKSQQFCRFSWGWENVFGRMLRGSLKLKICIVKKDQCLTLINDAAVLTKKLVA